MAHPRQRKAPGVYRIRCTTNGLCYLGASSDTYNRICGHKSRLRRNKHPLTRLQADFNEFGESSFQFNVIHVASDPTEALQTERKLLLDYADRTMLYNQIVYRPADLTRSRNNNMSGLPKQSWRFELDEPLLAWLRMEAKNRMLSMNKYLCDILQHMKDL